MQSGERRHDLDWLRVGAFGLLIFFHIGMFYSPWEWEVKSPRIVPEVLLGIEWSAPWRLLLLFVLAGAATRFMCRRQQPAELFVTRSLYLLPPLFFAVLLIIPPQSYFRAVEQFGYSGGLWRLWLRYLAFDRGICRDGACLVMPNWNHMWFVAYLWVYTTALLLVQRFAPAALQALSRGAAPLLRGRFLLVVPALGLGLAHIGLAHFFPERHDFVHDWYMHAVFVSGFLFGFLFGTDEAVARRAERLRWLALAVAIVSYAARTTYTWHYRDGLPIDMDLKVAMAMVYGFEQWAWVIAALGLAHRHLAQRGGPLLRYLNNGVFPFYVVHQTVIVVAAHELARLRLPLGVEALLLVAISIAGCLAAVELVRRLPVLHLWFGYKRRDTGQAPARPVRNADFGDFARARRWRRRILPATEETPWPTSR